MDPKKPLDIAGLSNFAELLSKGMGNMKPGEKPAWWQTYQYPEPPYCSSDQLINFTKIALFFQALSFGGNVYDYEHQGDFIGTNEAVIICLEANECKLVYQSFDKHFGKRTGLFFLIEGGGLYVQLANLKRPKLEYNCVTSDKKSFEKIKKLMAGFLSTEVKKNPLYMISVADHEPEFINLGTFSVPLNPVNYNLAAIMDYQYVVKQFNSDNPSGRLLLLNGIPGTGKTYIVRGLLNDLKSGTFLMAAPEMVSDLTKPQFIKSMLDAAQNKFAKGPLYLIIEDADIALLRRSGDNMGIISSLLNLADGLLGSAFDLRIIATTNANKLDMEPAILRPGRLCKSIVLDKLPAEQANTLLKSLNPESNKTYTTSTILAEVYASAAEVV
ncbi:MAG TPA: AAA family ATPase [Anaerovoracaceae bacterium]|nr:AAA family ATPase [Anaerovoracaceae bacterium]